MNIKIEDTTITTDRLYMRKLSLEDINDIYQIVKKDEVGQWLAASKGMSKQETETYVRNFVNHWNEHNFGVWAVIHKLSGNIIGHCGLRYVNQKEEDIEIMYK